MSELSENPTKYSLQELLQAYKAGQNVMGLLKSGNSEEHNLSKKVTHIEIAYDLQAGSYVEAMKDPAHARQKRAKCQEMANLLARHIKDPKSLLKAGVGEAVTLVPILDAFPGNIDYIHGFDISWSRISFARDFLDQNGYSQVQLCTGTLQQIPFAENSFEVIATSHALEPNGGYEEKILGELMRVSSNVVALFEPSYEFASATGKKRMIAQGYVRGLADTAKAIGFEILHNAPLSVSMNPNNPTAALILRVPGASSPSNPPQYSCPISESKLTKVEHGYFSPVSCRYYPVLKGFPNLRSENGVLCSALTEDLDLQ